MSPPRAAASVPNDATGDDAYARRLALSGMAPPSPPPPSHPAPPQPPTTTTTDRATISRAPVRYSPPPPPPQPDEVDIQDDYDPEVDYSSIPLPPPAPPTTTNTIDPDEQQNRTTRPGQKDFARRLMAKYGWTKGSGLGASASGITSALRVQVEKRRRKPDAEGGGFADPKGGRGRIIAPKTSITATNPHHNNDKGGGKEQGRFGKMSVVVLLEHMLDNMADLESEVEAGLGQEIGEECGERYGRVERIVVDVEGRRVFIKFVEGVSALRVSTTNSFRLFHSTCFSFLPSIL
ncbi:hypothetical protein N657DRAFT_125080 [Parathielavia appendiculata]|uniref:G-patch domain-containing protein n=1 Tax=Parathielavia appendiculata TaxID=2587402 RepID=A0AAN6Z0X5_9PEZI|nr:hypothetical protein N657DRAFT_125080 [Parathielavia appendiculata]